MERRSSHLLREFSPASAWMFELSRNHTIHGGTGVAEV
jgi:hypothetical protein